MFRSSKQISLVVGIAFMTLYVYEVSLTTILFYKSRSLTGTPIQNGVADIFSLFHFLGKSVQPLNDYSQ